MDQIMREVREIKETVHSSRRKLQTLECNAKESISTEVSSVSSSLKQDGHKIHHVSSQTKSFISQIEYHHEPEKTVDFHPQILWLRDSFQEIIRGLDDTKGKADGAIETTQSYTYNVMDVGHKVAITDEKLTECQSEAADIARRSQAELEDSERIVQETLAEIRSKEHQIRDKISEAASKRRQKEQLERDIENARKQVEEAERMREEEKKGAWAGLGLAAVGVIGAAFTFGGSLSLTAAGVGMATYRAVRMDEFENQARSARSNVSSLDSQISQNTRDVENLEREKTRLNVLVERHQCEIALKKSSQITQKKQIQEAQSAQGEIKTLKQYTDATKQNISEAIPELHKIKTNLEECSMLVKEKSIDLSESASLVEQFTYKIPFLGKGIKRTREFNRHMRLIRQASDTLEQIHSEISTLEFSNAGKFIDMKPSVTVNVVHLPIPEVKYQDPEM